MTSRAPAKAWLIDIEGVLVRDKAYVPLPGAVETLARLDAAGIPFCLVSNNTTHSPDGLVADLNGAGFSLTLDRLVGAVELGATWLRQRGRTRVLWLGAPRMADHWRGQGFELTDGTDCEAVMLGANPELSVDDLDQALPALLDRGADLVCLHRNLFYLDAAGHRRLGPGAWAAALEALQGAGQVVTIGKPSPGIYEQALKRVGVDARDALFISDDPVADLVTAGHLGMTTAFVLSGKYSDHGVLGRMTEDDWPAIVCAGLSDLADETLS